ncbi:MAG: LamG domain-containing protein, partial [Planctomycetota bacterium]
YGEDTGWGFFVGWQDRQGILAIGTAWPGSGTVTMTGGTVNVGVHVEVGAWGGKGVLDMTGGEMNITQGIYCPTFWWGGDGGGGRINLHGGTINARYIVMTEDPYGGTGRMDVTGGEMILDRNDEPKLQDIADGSVENMSITAYGVPDGNIITDSNYGAALGKRADLSIDYDVSIEGKTIIQAFTTEPNQAWNPSPPDGAANVKGPASALENPVLSWSAGANAATHEVYLGTSFADVNGATTGSGYPLYRGSQSLADVNYPVPEDLEAQETYYWRIDEVNGAMWKGDVWSFTIANLGKASYLSPADKATDVPILTKPSWTSGIYTDEHHVYLSTALSDVNGRNPAARTILPALTEEHDPGALDFVTQYYWAVDEVNGVNTWPSEVLTFTTDDHLVVDDMDSYGLIADYIYEIWTDGYNATPDNGTTSSVYLQTGAADANYVVDGNSMKVVYDNDKAGSGSLPRYAEVSASTSNLEVGSDWTIGDAKAAHMQFIGVADNGADPIYFGLEDSDSSAFVYYDSCDVNAITVEQWHDWYIDLEDFNSAGVDLDDIQMVYLGIGTRGSTAKTGDGEVYFDDIRLYPARCVDTYSYGFGDLTGDCVVNNYDLEIMSQDWLIQDYNVLGYTGTLTDFNNPDSAWQTGYDGNNALYFVGNVDSNGNLDCNHGGAPLEPAPPTSHVVCPPLGLTSDTVSMTAWIKLDGPQCGFGQGIIFMRQDAPATGMNIFLDVNGNPELAYHWDDEGWDFSSGLNLPENTWTFVGMVVTSGGCTLYMDSSSELDPAGGGGLKPVSFDSQLWLGRDLEWSGQSRNFRGWIDDARVYDIALSVSDINYVRTGIGTPPASEPYAWYKLDESSGTTASDAAGSAVNYFPVLSRANFVDPEPEYQRAVNFRDYCVIADSWLEQILFPLP